MPHHNPWPQYETWPGIEPGTFRLSDEWSTTELTLLLKLFMPRHVFVLDLKWFHIIKKSVCSKESSCYIYILGTLFTVSTLSQQSQRFPTPLCLWHQNNRPTRHSHRPHHTLCLESVAGSQPGGRCGFCAITRDTRLHSVSTCPL